MRFFHLFVKLKGHFFLPQFVGYIIYRIIKLDLISLAHTPKSDFGHFTICLQKGIVYLTHWTKICHITIETATLHHSCTVGPDRISQCENLKSLVKAFSDIHTFFPCLISLKNHGDVVVMLS